MTEDARREVNPAFHTCDLTQREYELTEVPYFPEDGGPIVWLPRETYLELLTRKERERIRARMERFKKPAGRVR